MKKHKSAFTLFRLSIVIVLIGILITGVSQGLEITYKARVANARMATNNSPIQSINGLKLWLETTLENSLARGTSTFTNLTSPENNQAIGLWNDLNSQSQNSTRNNATQTTSTSQPLFVRNGINQIPALYFDGVDDFISSATDTSTLDNFTIFIVAHPLNSCAINTPGSTAGMTGQRYAIYPQHGDTILPSSNAVGVGLSLCTNFIASVEHTTSYIPYIISQSSSFNRPLQITIKYQNKTPYLYINSVNKYTGTAGTRLAFASLSFGGGRTSGFFENYGYFKGYIGEVIFYDNDLDDNDRKLVESYLIDKWRIKI